MRFCADIVYKALKLCRKTEKGHHGVTKGDLCKPLSSYGRILKQWNIKYWTTSEECLRRQVLTIYKPSEFYANVFFV